MSGVLYLTVSTVGSILAKRKAISCFLDCHVLTSQNQVGDVRVRLCDQLSKRWQIDDDVVHRVVTIEIGVQDELRGISRLDDEWEDRLYRRYRSYAELIFSGLALLELRRIKDFVVDHFSTNPARR